MKRYILIVNAFLLAIALAGALAVGLLLIKWFSAYPAGAASNDKIPPTIFNSRLETVTASSATIFWQTDEQSDSLVNYGLNRNYGIVRDPFFDKTQHRIILDELMPDTTYYFRMISTDQDGNQTISNDFTFVTPGKKQAEQTPSESPSETQGVSPGPSQEPGKYPGKSETPGQFEMPSTEQVTKEQVMQIIETIGQISSEKVLDVIQQQIQNQAQQEAEKLEIIFDQVDVQTGTDYAIVKWRTNKDSNSIVSLVTEKDFNSSAADPYVWSEGSYEERVMDHSVTVNGLSAATTYHFMVSSETNLGLKSQSADKVFVTKAVLPEIYNISIVKIEEDSATINFATNIPCSSLVEYTNLDNSETKMEGSSNLSTAHSVHLSNLKFDTYYSAVITVENDNGDKTKSSPMTFLTIKDEMPPLISKISTESTLYPGSDNKVQTLVGFETDEMSICQLFYHQGLNAPEKVDDLPIEKDYAQKHVQVTTNLLPSTVYKFWVECYDDVGNRAKSHDFILLTPTREENIIDIILKNFETTFGWLKGFNKK